MRSGFESIGNRFWCTESEGNVVKKFDDEAALDLYKEFLGEERSERLPGVCLEYPFGLIAVKKVLGEDVPLMGFYTYGEIGPIDKMEAQLSVTKFHNETVVLWVLGSK